MQSISSFFSEDEEVDEVDDDGEDQDCDGVND